MRLIEVKPPSKRMSIVSSLVAPLLLLEEEEEKNLNQNQSHNPKKNLNQPSQNPPNLSLQNQLIKIMTNLESQKKAVVATLFLVFPKRNNRL